MVISKYKKNAFQNEKNTKIIYFREKRLMKLIILIFRIEK